MKKYFAIVLSLLMLLSFAACSKTETVEDNTAADETAADETAADETAEAAETGRTFTVGFDAEFPPFGFIAEDGSYDGFDLAMAEEVCKRLDWNFVAMPIDWNAKDSELASGTIDCIWNGFTKSGREDEYAWTDAYYDNSIVMVVKADSGIASVADLAGKIVAVQQASSAEDALNGEDMTEVTASFGSVLPVATYQQAFMELSQGTADAVCADIGVAKYNMGDDSAQYVILDEKVSSEQYAIGFLKGNDELAAQVWAVVEEIAADGTMAQLADQYVEYGLTKDNLTLIGA